jgi:hypothetical protein
VSGTVDLYRELAGVVVFAERRPERSDGGIVTTPRRWDASTDIPVCDYRKQNRKQNRQQDRQQSADHGLTFRSATPTAWTGSTHGGNVEVRCKATEAITL